MIAAADNFFLDTNVLLYSVDPAEALKQPIARQWISTVWFAGRGHISWQVVFEFYSNAVRKHAARPIIARAAVEDLLLWKPELPGEDTLHRAWHWCDSAKINFWDALIVAAAEQSGCRWLLSEDFQSGRRFGEVTVVNPFERPPAEFGLQ
jgi:predicted nucleic acid-binding protein